MSNMKPEVQADKDYIYYVLMISLREQFLFSQLLQTAHVYPINGYPHLVWTGHLHVAEHLE